MIQTILNLILTEYHTLLALAGTLVVPKSAMLYAFATSACAHLSAIWKKPSNWFTSTIHAAVNFCGLNFGAASNAKTIPILNFLSWFVFLPAHILIVLSRYFLAPLAVTFFSTPDKTSLRSPFKWLMTLDNTLAGDYGWQHDGGIKPGSDPLSWINRVRWLWRNGGNAINYQAFGCDYSDQVPPLSPDGSAHFIRADGYWLLRVFIPAGGQSLELFWGWGLYGQVNGRCKLTFSTRLKKK